MTKEQKRISNHNNRLAWKHFYPEGNGNPKKGYVLHHVDTTLKKNDIERYILWRIEDLVMLTKAEHIKVHHKGKQVSEETKRKIGEASKGRHYHLSEETRHKMSEAKQGHLVTEETRKKISESLKRRFAL